MTDLQQTLAQALNGRRYAILGAGQLGAMSLDLWPDTVALPEFFLDSHKSGDLRGIPIHDLKQHVPVPGITYLVGAFTIPPRQLKAMMDALGQSFLLTVYDVFQQHTPTVFGNGWHNYDAGSETLACLQSSTELYADELSRRNWNAAAEWRYRRVLSDDYPLGPQQGKYDLRPFGRGGVHYEVVYDCGSFDLSLLDWLASAEITYDRMVAFEPDPGRYAACKRLLEEGKLPSGGITLDRRAISDRAGSVPFLANSLLAARIIRDTTLRHPKLTAVDTCTLDAQSPVPNQGARILIKLHIEGSELPALKGAANLLERTRADILLNLSHDEPSLLEIPRWIASLGRHDLFLRSHALFGEGMTLFARHH